MIHLFLVRHGRTDSNEEQRLCGHQDIPLNDEGYRQAKLLGKALADLKLDWVYTSDLSRAHETAFQLLLQREEPFKQITYTSLLREMDFGPWEGKTLAETGYGQASRYSHFFGLDGGEKPQDVDRRARQFLQMIVTLHPNQYIMAVAHGFFNCCLTAALLGDDLTPETLRPQMNTSVNYFLLDNDGRLMASKLNTISHLVEGSKHWIYEFPSF